MPLLKLTSVLLLALLCAACGSSDGRAPPVVTSRDNLESNPEVARACGKTPDHVVLINDFAYSPLSLDVKVGETVAWVNQEVCGDYLPENIASPLTGCDTHHEVVTFPTLGTDSLNGEDICSPTRGILPPPGSPGPAVNDSNCAQERGSNVYCHTFTSPGVQHYTCFTNAAHTAVLNGFINVTQ